MKRIIITIVLTYLSLFSFAHEGEDHGNAKRLFPAQ